MTRPSAATSAASPSKGGSLAEFLSNHGMTVRSFRAPGGSGTLGAVLVETPDMETLQAAQSGHEAHVAEADDGVLTDTVSIFVAGWPQPRPTAVWSALLDRARGEAPNDVLLKE